MAGGRGAEGGNAPEVVKAGWRGEVEAWERSPRMHKDCLILGSAHAGGLKRRRIFVLSPQIPYCVLLDMISGHRCFGKARGEQFVQPVTLLGRRKWQSKV